MKPESKILLSVIAALAASAVIGLVAFDVLRGLQVEFERIERLTEITDKTHALPVLTGSFRAESLRGDVQQARQVLVALERLAGVAPR
ncbi:hypothetical protein EG829_23645, partial [bacterium]|nr:hypothetical protein [bacterium]